MDVGAVTVTRRNAARAAELLQARDATLADPASPLAAKLSADQLERVKTSRAAFVAAQPFARAEAQIVGLWCEHNRAGLPRMRWKGPGDPESFYMAVKVKNGDWRSVVPELWTNVKSALHPEQFEGIPMAFHAQQGDVVTFKVTLPIDTPGNFRVTGRISTSGDPANPAWKWSGQFGVGDIRFRPRAVEHESISEQVVHVGLANADPSGWNVSTFRDLIDPTFGKYNLWAIKAAGRNTIRLQPPFRHDPWDRAHPYDTLGSPYAATDFFTIDPRYSRDCWDSGVPSWDKDKLRDIANAEFWAVVDKAHELGMRVILDVALNHMGHNVTFRDLFSDPVAGERVVRNNFDQITVDPGQADAVKRRLQRNPTAAAEDLFPEMFAHKWGDPAGARSVSDTIAGGNGQWTDTKQLNHGGFDFGGRETRSAMNESVTDWFTRIMKYWVDPPANEPGAPRHPRRGVDGFRLDHATNLPARFYERSLTQLQAMVKKPIAIVAEDFNQGDKLRVYADAMESGWYHNLMSSFKTSDIAGILGTVGSDWYFETLRGGNHDEERVINYFGGDMLAAGRYLCMIDLIGGWSTTVMGDEYGESRKVEFKHKGGVPPVLVNARYDKLTQANVEMQLAMQRAGQALQNDPALATTLFAPLWADGPEHHILGVARHADDPALPGTLLFANLANADVLENKFWLDGETRRRIDPNGWYQARDLMSKDPSSNVWGRWLRGSDLLANGVYVRLLPYQIQALKLERMG